MSKKYKFKTQSESVDMATKLEKAKAKRLEKHLSKQSDANKETNTKEEFRKFFAKLKAKYKLEASLEAVIWLHFKAYNFDSKDKFEQGIKHFGNIGE
jgi:hypothetical protein